MKFIKKIATFLLESKKAKRYQINQFFIHVLLHSLKTEEYKKSSLARTYNKKSQKSATLTAYFFLFIVCVFISSLFMLFIIREYHFDLAHVIWTIFSGLGILYFIPSLLYTCKKESRILNKEIRHLTQQELESLINKPLLLKALQDYQADEEVKKNIAFCINNFIQDKNKLLKTLDLSDMCRLLSIDKDAALKNKKLESIQLKEGMAKSIKQ